MSPMLSSDDDQLKSEVVPNRNRKYYSYSVSASDLTQTKHILLEKEEQKLEFMKKIELTMEKIEYNLKRMGDILIETIPEILANQEILLAPFTQPSLESLQHPLAVGPYVSQPYIKNFPTLPLMYPPTTNY